MKNKRRAFICLTLVLTLAFSVNVSAADKISRYARDLKKKNLDSLIINVDVYKAAYPDLYAAFGDNNDKYLDHFLRYGAKEGRNLGVMFNPVAYSEAYADVSKSCGTDITKIINHYVTTGIKEQRFAATAPASPALQGNVAASKALAGQKGIATAAASALTSLTPQTAALYSAPAAASTGAASYSSGAVSASKSAAAYSAAPAAYSAAAYSAPTAAAAAANTLGFVMPSYTSKNEIYNNGKLVRVEYYTADSWSSPAYYSVVSNYSGSGDTASYNETVYSYNADTSMEKTHGSNVVENGSIVSSTADGSEKKVSAEYSKEELEAMGYSE